VLSLLNKSFIKFTIGFLGIVLVSLILTFVAGWISNNQEGTATVFDSMQEK
jgi:hypothetical protein